MNELSTAPVLQVLKDERKLSYLNAEGMDRPLISTLGDAVLDRARGYRIARLRAKMAEYDCDAMLMYDPVNIRYAFDSSNMSIWTMHNAARYALVLADGGKKKEAASLLEKLLAESKAFSDADEAQKLLKKLQG